MMAMPLAVGAVALVTVVVALATSPGAEDRRDAKVSLVQLIATPATFDGKRISLVGYVVLDAENAVYLSEGDARHGVARNALWLDIPAVGDSARLRFHAKYVFIEGRFNAQRRGHRERFGGTIEQIGRFEPVEPRPGPLMPTPH